MDRSPPLMLRLPPSAFTEPLPTKPTDPRVTVPMGKGGPSGVKNSALLYDEFIVYDTSQIQSKYVLQVKFHFKNFYY